MKREIVRWSGMVIAGLAIGASRGVDSLAVDQGLPKAMTVAPEPIPTPG